MSMPRGEAPMSSSKLSVLCDRIIEAGWLAALIVIPLFFNMYSRRNFEADKLLLLRSIATVMAVAWIAKWIEQRLALRSLLRSGPALPLLALVAACLLTTLTSITPRVSFFGSYTRLQGTYTVLAYVVIAALLAHGLRTRRQVGRLVKTLILSSFPVALYAVLQRCGFDPLWEQLTPDGRVFSSMGNPIYLAAYLAMAFCLTLGKIAQDWQGLRDDATARLAGGIEIVVYALIGFTQLGGMVFAVSRGPLLGWLAGVGLFILLLALLLRKRGMAWGLIGAGLVVVALLVALGLPAAPLSALRSLPMVGRLFNLTASSGDSAQVRVLIWQGALDLVQPHAPLQFPDSAPDPLNLIRPLVGYGPESLYLVFGQVFPHALATQTGYGGGTAVGRSHNETWDALVTGGLAGLLAYQVLFAGLFLYGLRALGLIAHGRERNAFIGLWGASGLLVGLLSLVWRQPQYLGAAIALGNLCGLLLYLIYTVARWQGRFEPALPRADRLLIAALLSGILVHYVEIQFGFGVAATRLLLWTFAGLMVALGSKRLLLEKAQDPALQGEASLRQSVPWLGGALGLAAIIALIMLTLLYAFITNVEQLADPARILLRSLSFNALQGQASYAVPGLLSLTCVLALIAGLAGMARSRMLTDTRSVLAATTLSTLLALGLAGILSFGLAGRVALLRNYSASAQDALTFAGWQVRLFDYYAAGLFALLLLMALALLAEDRRLPAAWAVNRWSWAALVPLVLAAWACVNTLNLDSIRADMLYQQGERYARWQEWDYAIALYKRAIDRAPYEDVYCRGMGQALLGKAVSASPDSPARFDEQTPLDRIWSVGLQPDVELNRADLFYAARAVFLRGRALNPLNADHSAGLALTYRRWAELTAEPAQRASLVEQSSQYYAAALRLTPQDAQLKNDWAMLDPLLMGGPGRVLGHTAAP